MGFQAVYNWGEQCRRGCVGRGHYRQKVNNQLKIGFRVEKSPVRYDNREDRQQKVLGGGLRLTTSKLSHYKGIQTSGILPKEETSLVGQKRGSQGVYRYVYRR